eukprot:TRINITY_DN15415_c0_g3_i1.p1 TRINITY_DN15415_c0_g3~~TRINITY_DN15415_c0_g3_i1.p1  ORF type:complete len:1410 (-),score=290.88 TRINITY_DN15415_c0_g3_i1:493-4722(-)
MPGVDAATQTDKADAAIQTDGRGTQRRRARPSSAGQLRHRKALDHALAAEGVAAPLRRPRPASAGNLRQRCEAEGAWKPQSHASAGSRPSSAPRQRAGAASGNRPSSASRRQGGLSRPFKDIRSAGQVAAGHISEPEPKEQFDHFRQLIEALPYSEASALSSSRKSARSASPKQPCAPPSLKVSLRPPWVSAKKTQKAPKKVEAGHGPRRQRPSSAPRSRSPSAERKSTTGSRLAAKARPCPGRANGLRQLVAEASVRNAADCKKNSPATSPLATYSTPPVAMQHIPSRALHDARPASADLTKSLTSGFSADGCSVIEAIDSARQDTGSRPPVGQPKEASLFPKGSLGSLAQKLNAARGGRCQPRRVCSAVDIADSAARTKAKLVASDAAVARGGRCSLSNADDQQRQLLVKRDAGSRDLATMDAERQPGRHRKDRHAGKCKSPGKDTLKTCVEEMTMSPQCLGSDSPRVNWTRLLGGSESSEDPSSDHAMVTDMVASPAPLPAALCLPIPRLRGRSANRQEEGSASGAALWRRLLQDPDNGDGPQVLSEQQMSSAAANGSQDAEQPSAAEQAQAERKGSGEGFASASDSDFAPAEPVKEKPSLRNKFKIDAKGRLDVATLAVAAMKEQGLNVGVAPTLERRMSDIILPAADKNMPKRRSIFSGVSIPTTEPDRALLRRFSLIGTPCSPGSTRSFVSAKTASTSSVSPMGAFANKMWQRSWCSLKGHGLLANATSTEKVMEERMFAAFKRLSEHGEIDSSHLHTALESIGYRPADHPEWIPEVLEQVTFYATLDWEQFSRFCKGFDRREERACAEVFNQYDGDGSGSIDIRELADMLAANGIVPLGDVLDELVCQATGSDPKYDGLDNEDVSLTLQQFRLVLRWLRVSEGFTKADRLRLISAFKEFARQDANGELQMTVQDAGRTLTWLGFNVDASVTARLTSEVDIDGTGSFSEHEFLILMRRVREHEMDTIRRLTKAPSKDINESFFSKSDLPRLLRNLGYMANGDALSEVLSSFKGKTTISIAHVWRCLEGLREREGFSTTEDDEVEHVFLRHQTSNFVLSEHQACKVVRKMGYAVEYHSLQKLLFVIDVLGSGYLTSRCFKKLVRKLREKEIADLHDAFATAAGQREELPADEAALLLQQLGLSGAARKVRKAVNLDEFEQKAVLDIPRARQCCAREGGFTVQDVEELQEQFNKYDTDLNGEIEKEEMRCLFMDLAPDLATSAEARPKLMELLNEADGDGNGSLDFGDFKRLAASLRDLQEVSLKDRERISGRDGRFSRKEVEDLRELYCLFGGGESAGGSILKHQVECFLDRLKPLGSKLREAFNTCWEEVVDRDRQVCMDGSLDSLENGGELAKAAFPEFLTLMRRLMDENFAGIWSTPVGSESAASSPAHSRPASPVKAQAE